MINKKLAYKAFTLTELIVVIVILAILALIAFLSFGSYLAMTRNSTRLSDISWVNTSLEMFLLKSWSYPAPDNWFVISYLWWSVWNQWTISDNFIRKLWNVSKKVVDPLTNKEYTYSVLSYSKNSFVIKSDYEWDSISYM